MHEATFKLIFLFLIFYLSSSLQSFQSTSPLCIFLITFLSALSAAALNLNILLALFPSLTSQAFWPNVMYLHRSSYFGFKRLVLHDEESRTGKRARSKRHRKINDRTIYFYILFQWCICALMELAKTFERLTSPTMEMCCTAQIVFNILPCWTVCFLKYVATRPPDAVLNLFCLMSIMCWIFITTAAVCGCSKRFGGWPPTSNQPQAFIWDLSTL